MGQYLIPGSDPEDVGHLIQHVVDAGVFTPDMSWDGYITPEGVIFFDPSRTDEQCEALYADWQQVVGWKPPLPEAILTHLGHLRDYRDADPATITDAQTVHVVKDLIRAVHFLNSRFEIEG